MMSKSTCNNKKDFPNNIKWTRCKYPKWEVVHGAPDRVNIPCLTHMAPASVNWMLK